MINHVLLNCIANAYKYCSIASASMWKQEKYVCAYVYFSLLLFLVCKSGPTSNYTLILDVSSRVLVQGEIYNYALAGEEVALVATVYNNLSNFTDSNNQSQVYYYNFQCRSASTGNWYPINCSEESTAVEIWNTGGRFECLVQLLTQDNKPLACDSTQIVIAGNILIQCNMTMLYDKKVWGY